MTYISSVICGLRTRRETLGWSLDRLGRRSGIDAALLSAWENGRGAPRLDELGDWAAALGFTFKLVAAEGKPRHGLQVDWDKRSILVDGDPVRLTRMEWKALEFLARTPDALVTQRALFRHLYGDDQRYQARSTAVRVLITKLRRLLPIQIHAQWGQGYVISGLPPAPDPIPSGASRADASAAPQPRVVLTPGERIRPMSKLPPTRLRPVDPGPLRTRRDVGAAIQVGERRAAELGVIERFLAERGVTRCPDVGTIQHSPLPALIWDKEKRKWVRPSEAAQGRGPISDRGSAERVKSAR